MPITIPTTEFVGLLNDVIPFALDEPDFPALCCVRVAWDGKELAAQAHDGLHMAWSRWNPDDDPDDGEVQESILEQWGGHDEPWSVVITLAHAKELAKAFKLGTKYLWTPLTVGVRHDGALRITRNRVPGLMGFEATVEKTSAGHEFPDFEEVLAKSHMPQALDRVAFNAEQLSHFSTVRPRGPMELVFNGPRAAVLVRIGERFTGAISPTRAAERHLQAAA